MSRMPAALMILATAASPAAAQRAVTVEEAFGNYRTAFKAPADSGCLKEADPDPDDIIVCGRRPGVDPNRLPLPVEREPGERIKGEAATMGPDCIRLCHQPVKVDLIKTIPAVVEGIKKILDPDR